MTTSCAAVPAVRAVNDAAAQPLSDDEFAAAAHRYALEQWGMDRPKLMRDLVLQHRRLCVGMGTVEKTARELVDLAMPRLNKGGACHVG
jgi:hypothetical protein